MPPPANNIEQFNWGAFFFGAVWGCFNKVWISLIIIPISFIPLIGLPAAIIFSIWLGLNGNKLAWKNQKWDSIEQFQIIQQRWAVAGLILLSIPFLLYFALRLIH